MLRAQSLRCWVPWAHPAARGAVRAASRRCHGSATPDGMPDLEKLLAFTALGDRDAFSQLYEATRRRAWAICLRLLRDPAQAEDAMQDAYVKVWHQASSYRPAAGAAEAWLAAVVRNTCRDRLRSQRRDLADSMEELPAATELADPAPNPEQRLEASLSQGRVRQCFEALQPRQRELLTDSYVLGLSHSELSERRGMALGTVKTIIRRSVLALRDCLGQAAS